MDNNAQNLTNAQNQPQPAAGPAPRPTMPGPAQMGAAPRPVAPPTPISAMPNFGGPSPAASAGASATPANPAAPGTNPAAPNPTTSAPGANPAANAPAKKGLPKKTLYIIIGCIAAVVVIACIIIAVVMMNSGKKTDNTPAPAAVQTQPAELTPIDELDKDGMIQAFDDMQEKGYNPGDSFTEPLISQVYGHTVQLTDSYADAEDLKDRTDLYDDEYDISVTESDSGTYATIMAVDEDGNSVDGTFLYVAFNEKYAEYDSSKGMVIAYIKQDDSNPLFVDTSEEFLKEALPILYVAGGKPYDTIYDIDFETDDEEITMNVSTITYNMGSSSSSSSASSSTTKVTTDDNATETDTEEESVTEEESSDEASPYVIQGSTGDLIVNLEDGTFYSSGEDEVVNSFPVSEDEFKLGFQAMGEFMGYGDEIQEFLGGGSTSGGNSTKNNSSDEE